MAILSLAALETATWMLFEPLAGAPADVVARERSARLAAIAAHLTSDETGGGLIQIHPFVGYVRRPGSLASPDNPVPYNAFGMVSVQGHAFPYERRPGDFVVAVLGGSVAEIFANTAEDHLATALEVEDPRFAERRLVLLSLATGGYKQPQQLLMLEYMLLSGFDFDLVLNIDGYNDLVFAVENERAGANRVFPSVYHFGPLGESLRAGPDPDVIQRMHAVLTAYDREARVLAFVEGAPWRHSPFLNALGHRFTRFSQARIDRLELDLAVSGARAADAAFRGPPLPSATDPIRAAADLWREGSAMTDAVCRARGIPYVHVLQPNQYVEGSKTLTAREREVAYAPDHPWAALVRDGYGALVEAGGELRAEGVAFHDLSGVFRDVPDDLYIDDCCHFNGAGNRILAGAVARAIVERIDSEEISP